MTAPPTEHRASASRRRRDLVAVGAVTIAAVALLYARLPFAARQLWAEDGRAFLGDALRFGPIRAFGHSEAGYYLTVPRVGAAIASLLPLRDAALVTWLWVAMVNAWMVATVTVASRTWLRTWPARGVAALAIVLVPVLGMESIGNAANLQFLMLYASSVVLVSVPRGRLERANGAALLVATGLTTPLAALLAPLFVLRLVWRRSWRPDVYALAWLSGVVVQWSLIAVTRPPSEPRASEPLSVLLTRVELIGVERNLLPVQFERYRGPIFLVVVLASVAGVALLAWSRGERRRASALVAVPATGIGMVSVLSAVSGAPFRYPVFTALCLVWAVLACAETLGDALGGLVPAGRSIAATVAATLLVVAFVVGWAPSELRRSGTTWHESLDAARAECASRPGGSVRVRTSPQQPDKPDQWSVVVSCAEIG